MLQYNPQDIQSFSLENVYKFKVVLFLFLFFNTNHYDMKPWLKFSSSPSWVHCCCSHGVRPATQTVSLTQSPQDTILVIKLTPNRQKVSTTMEYEHITHSFEPIYNEDSEILILGTLPSVKSRENNFYYGHKQNRFWKLLAKLCEEETPQTVEEKTAMLLRHHIAIWDVIQSCDIKGSSDSSIKNVTPTDLKQILDHCQIRQIYANGNKAGALYKKYQQPLTERDILVLPSTSPANAAWSLDRLYEKWSEILR